MIHDLVGLFDKKRPKFVKQYVNLWDIITKAVQDYCKEVKEEAFPTDAHSFH